MIAEWAQQVLAQVCEKSPGRVQFSNSQGRDEICQELIKLARTKLVFGSQDISASRSKFERTPQTACVDVRLMLTFEPGRFASHHEEMILVSSHMRTVFSITQARDVVRSGYPSEPILAEAAAQQLHHWSTLEGSDSNPTLRILEENLRSDLLSRGELGEVVGRSLLLAPRDRVAVRMRQSDSPISFSKPVPLVLFLEELLDADVAYHFLNSKPNNIAESDVEHVTLRDAFKHSVINFSHFGKFADDAAMSQDAALAAFIRGMAIISRNHAPIVDGGIPVVIDDREPLSPDNTNIVAFQFKRRSSAGSTASTGFRVEELDFFPKPPRGTKQLNPDHRPYITLVMELGVSPSDPLAATTPTNPQSKKAQQVIAIMNDPESMEYTPDIAPSAAIDSYITLQTKIHRSRSQHPRYSIFLNGCCSILYRVIRPHETDDYRRILQCGDLLGDHPRQEPSALRGVRMQRPFFSVGVAFHWIVNDVLNSLGSRKGYHVV